MPGTTETRTPETILAFDFGLRRIGVAVGQSVTASATPIATLSPGSFEALRRQVEALIAEWRPQRLIVGQPAWAETHTTLETALKGFVALLADAGLPVELVDESLSSVEASARLKQARQQGARRSVRKEHIDAESARVIAERWLSRDARRLR